MKDKIIEKFRNKNIAILGFGKEGISTYKFLREGLKDEKITIIDKVDKSNDEMFKDDKNVFFISGDNYLDNLDKFDYIVKSPGVNIKDIDISSFKERITSQLELLLEVYRDNIIGVTGTKGKSTTSSLIYEVLKDQGKDTYLVGNIGIPVLSEIDKYKKDTILVIEMSTQQLEFVKTSPHIGMILNLFQDHLDLTGTLEHYHNNKMNMFRYQNENDIAMYSSDNDYLIAKMKEYDYKAIKYDVRFDYENITDNSIRIKDGKVYLGKELIYEDGERKLIGDHYLKDIMFVMGVAKILGLDLEKAKESIANFGGLKYRMECIGKYDGIIFYNDTIATIPEATINAIKALKTVDSLIFGGMDRNIDYSEFVKFLENSEISNLICMPTTGNKIGKLLEKKKKVFYADTLEKAHEIAVKETKKDMICLLSPAAASYEFFKNFEEKGKKFEEIVKGE
ncbi:MAG: UDP-N-acetylmuramoyl-L-alanine--D-glutamate ligase [Bacilli bacterium]|nr:UDP-N-acetylmuramoyl-L-alanine--D-glutamate ligase [Bacilli bacterium]